MTNVFDYLKWRGDLSFSQDPPNAVMPLRISPAEIIVNILLRSVYIV